MSLEILHADEHLLAVNKPSGLLSVPGRGPEKQDCLARRLEQAWGPLLVVHRLDRDTSGVILFARTPAAQQSLSRQFETRRVEKRYLAVAIGRLAETSGVIDLPVAKDFARPPRHRVDYTHGRPAVTHWRTLGGDQQRTRLELRPVTGRSHQLRVHLAAVGHPIFGDRLYSVPDEILPPTAGKRLHLHACRLSVEHPELASPLEIACASPF